MKIDDIPYIKGWGHKTGPITLEEKINYSKNNDYIFPHVKDTIDDAFRRASMPGVESLSLIHI